MKSREEQISAGRRHVEQYMASEAGKAAAERFAPQLQAAFAELKRAFADFMPMRNEVDHRLSALGFGPFKDDDERLRRICGLIEIDPEEGTAGDVYRKVRGWLDREQLKANMSKTPAAKSGKPNKKRKKRATTSPVKKAVYEVLSRNPGLENDDIQERVENKLSETFEDDGQLIRKYVSEYFKDYPGKRPPSRPKRSKRE